jgi:peptidoglycan-associated lipoprotein
MKRYGILLAVFMAFVLAITLTSGCSTPKKATKEDVTKSGTKPGLSDEELAKQRAEQEARERALREQAIRDQEARDRAAAAGASSLKDLSRIYFDFDRAELSSEAREILGKVAAQLKASPKKALTIEGNCDDRGTNEYNLASASNGRMRRPAISRTSGSTANGSRPSAMARNARSARRRRRPAGTRIATRPSFTDRK